MGIFRRKRKAAQRVAAQLNELQSDLTALRKDAKDFANGIGKVAGSAVDAAEDTYDGVEKWTAGNLGSMRSSVRNQPLTACLVSLGAGAVLGALLLRR
jgi:ElaB/YqjD/DUF883 family membrane-anchored ribosome-binding protein